jgi:vacuolar-type H+-ATPase subunit H
MTEKEGDETTETEEETTEEMTEGAETGEETTEEVEETAQEAVEETRETVEETAEEAEEQAEEIGERVEESAESFLDSVDDNVDRLLSEILDTRSRVAVYVGLRQKEEATPDEVAEETGLYPDKVERVLEELEDEDVVETAGGGRYAAVSPTELVRRVPESVGGWLSDIITSGDKEEEVHETTEIDVE